MPEITIYSTQACPYCMRAKQLLERKGIGYQEIDVTDDAERAKMIEKSGGRRTVPQIFIGAKHVGGFDDLNALEQAGKLDALLAV